MSRSHGRVTVQNFPGFAQNLENFMRKLKIIAFQFFFFIIHTYYVILGVISPLFLAQNFRIKAYFIVEIEIEVVIVNQRFSVH